MLKHLQLS